MGNGDSIDDASSFSLVSADWATETIRTPSVSQQETDEFDLVLDSGDDDEYDEDDGDGARRPHDLASCSSTSVPPSIYHHEFEHDRRYHSFKTGRYPLPNDISSQHAEELLHHLAQDLTKGHLFLSDIGEHPHKILDLGTGSGLWVIDVADQYPSASVIGTDLSPIQPKWLPMNARMFVDDCEDDDWLHGSGFDLIHLRGVMDVLHDVPAMMDKIYTNLKIGGWAETQDFVIEVCCDDSSMKPDDHLRTFFNLSSLGMRQLGCASFGCTDVRSTFEKAGFTNIQYVAKKVPVGPWAQDKRQQMTGMIMKTILQEWLDAFAAKPLAALGLSAEERKHLVTCVRTSLEDQSIHRYVRFGYCFAQKGPSMASDTEMETE